MENMKNVAFLFSLFSLYLYKYIVLWWVNGCLQYMYILY